MITEAVLYLAGAGDAWAALLPVARRPAAFRMLMAALRAGCRRVHVPARFRATELGRLVAATPSARAAVRWLAPGAPPPERPVLLLPAAGVATPAALAPLLAAAGTPRLDHEGEAPVAAVPAALAAALWPGLADGRPMGDTLARELKGAEPVGAPAGGWYARVASARDAREAEQRLYAALGTAIDTRLDRLVHRRLARPLTRLALRLEIGPNPVTLASLGVGLAAAWCFWSATPGRALLGLACYVLAVVLDHADGEVARLSLRESAVGEWLDVAVDTAVHALLVLVMGVTAEQVTGHGLLAGVVAAGGVVGSSAVTKTSPPAAGPGVGAVLRVLGNRDGFYAMLAVFIVGLAAWPALLPPLMAVVAAGSHAFWLVRLMYRLAGLVRLPGRA